MEKNSEHRKIMNVISDMYVLSGIRATILDEQGRELYLCPGQSRFCELIQSTAEGRTRCMRCNLNAIQSCREREGCAFQRCHAGLIQGSLSLSGEENTTFYLLFGQYLDDADRDRQWKETKKLLSWYPGELTQLEEAYEAIRQYSKPQVTAYLGIIYALRKYIATDSGSFSSRDTDQHRLEQYLNEHYMEKLSLTSISKELGIGRTRLCALARSLPGDMTISKMITHLRIQEACVLLLQTDLAISHVSERVGISDYNYFSKVFRSATGLTPSAYRRAELSKQCLNSKNFHDEDNISN